MLYVLYFVLSVYFFSYFVYIVVKFNCIELYRLWKEKKEKEGRR